MCSLIQNAQQLDLAQKCQWQHVKYQLFIAALLELFFQESCEETGSCTAVNWKHGGNHECILRACSLPVVPPATPYQGWMSYYVIHSNTTATTTTASTTTATITTSTPTTTTTTTATTSPIIYGS